MTRSDEQKREEAMGWFLSLRDPASADWDGFTLWLEQDPAHSDLYEEIALADGDYGTLVENAAPSIPSNDNAAAGERWHVRRRFAGWAVAVVALIGGVGYPLLNRSPETYAIETGIGQRNSITLDDGTRIELNGSSRITLRKGDNRFASLDRGEATFTVSHDASNPFTVHVGDEQVQDVGTVFNIVRAPEGLETAVASGAVVYNPGREAVRVTAGQKLQITGGSMALTSVAPRDVASWRVNKLIYKDAPLGRIAADLSRNLGTPVRVSPSIAAQRFSGVLMLEGQQAVLLPKIGALLDVTMTHEQDGWHMSSRIRDSR